MAPFERQNLRSIQDNSKNKYGLESWCHCAGFERSTMKIGLLVLELIRPIWTRVDIFTQNEVLLTSELLTSKDHNNYTNQQTSHTIKTTSIAWSSIVLWALRHFRFEKFSKTRIRPDILQSPRQTTWDFISSKAALWSRRP